MHVAKLTLENVKRANTPRRKESRGSRVEMCLERKGKKREQERNWKEHFSFLSHSSIF